MTKEHGQLGELELAVMKIIWKDQEPLDVHEVVKRLDPPRAYTTVMTTLQRLYRKGHLNREKEGRAYLYSVRVTQQKVLERMLRRIADNFFKGDIRMLVPTLMGSDDKLTDEQRKALRVLTESIED